MKNSFLIFLLLVTVFICSNEALACTCRKDTEEINTPEKLKNVVLKAVRNSTAVFSGEVTAIDKFDVKLKVTKVWKGNITETEIIISRWYYTKVKAETYVECSFQSFQVGKSYLLYVDKFENKLQVNDCSRTQFYDKAGKELDALNSLKLKEN